MNRVFLCPDVIIISRGLERVLFILVLLHMQLFAYHLTDLTTFDSPPKEGLGRRRGFA
jgi:hypothetical protein